MAGMEWHLAEKPTLDALQAIGYAYIAPSAQDALRDGDNQVLFRPELIDALQRINGISAADAHAAYAELLTIGDNAQWLSILRGNFSRTVEGKATKQTLRVIDFLKPENNRFTVTHQFRVQAHKVQIPDVVVHINGIPVVVIECKSPISAADKSGEGFEQIKRYERDIPRLFLSNCFNIVTDGTNCLYGATGSGSQFYATWRDPWPKTDADFANTLDKGLWCLLEPSRLLDLIAHFIVFEQTDTGTIKKICRYQQFRAVNKIVNRVVDGEHRRGLIWHTQGSGKSLTMVYAALKLKTHLTLSSPVLASPNLMVLTDRIDLDTQISGTFNACGLANPISVKKISELRDLINKGVDGLTVLSTIFKFEGSSTPVPNSRNWIVMVDECHRTQEKDLGAYLRKTLPDSWFFGFTGTPVKKTDRDTYANFGIEGEGYLDKYGIDDAVADGATVPIYYTGRKTEWQIDEAKIDSLFDHWFAEYDEATIAEIKRRGVQVDDLLKHPKRIELIAFDIWTHFKEYARPDGFKAQLVACDREAIILYKRALDRAIAEDLTKDGMDPEAAKAAAEAMTVCIYSSSGRDQNPSEDPYLEGIRQDLVRHYVNNEDEKTVKKAFGRKGEDPQILIVCDKLLTGFDCPIESVMYLDKPLKEHSLLQAIARTNRVADAQKRNGLIVDYIGVSAKLDEALDSYRADDVKNAMRDLDDLRNQLRAAHAAVMAKMKGLKRRAGPKAKDDWKAEFDALIAMLGNADEWAHFKDLARQFIALYETVSPDPSVLEFADDLKWIATFLQYATQVFEKKEAFDQQTYSRKIREMLAKHLDATGLRMTVKLRHITDPDFWKDFDTTGKTEDDLKTAAIRKTTELRKTVTERIEDKPHSYGKFSERLRELLEKLDDAQLSWAEKLKAAEELAKAVQAEDEAHVGSGLSEGAYGLLAVLKALGADEEKSKAIAVDVEALYTNKATAPHGWWEKDGVRKELRQRVRSISFEKGVTDPALLKSIPEQVETFALKHLRGL